MAKCRATQNLILCADIAQRESFLSAVLVYANIKLFFGSEIPFIFSFFVCKNPKILNRQITNIYMAYIPKIDAVKCSRYNEKDATIFLANSILTFPDLAQEGVESEVHLVKMRHGTIKISNTLYSGIEFPSP